MKLWLLWDRGMCQDEHDTLLGIYDNEAAAQAAREHTSKITVERSDGSTFRPYGDTYRLEVEQRCDISALPSYDVSDGLKIVESEEFERTVHGPQTEHESLTNRLLARIEMDLYRQR